MLTRRKATGVQASSGDSTIDYQNLDAGEHEGRLVLVADLGLQRKEYKGEFKGNFQQIALGIEICGKSFSIDGEEKPVMLWTKPFVVYDSLTEKGNELVYALAFDPTARPDQSFDWDGQLGAPCNVVIGHTQDKQDPEKKYDNITRISSIPEKYRADVPTARMNTASGDGADVTSHLYGLTKFVYDRKVYEEEAVQDHATTVQHPVLDNSADFDDEIPF